MFSFLIECWKLWWPAVIIVFGLFAAIFICGALDQKLSK